jgi:hypothetical protein
VDIARRRASEERRGPSRLALLVSLAGADLLGARPVLPRLAAAVARHTPASVPLVAGALAVAVAYDTWPLALRRRGRALRLVARVARALDDESALEPLRMLVAGDARAVAEAITLRRVPADPDASWTPVLHLALLDEVWSARRHTDVAAAVQAFQELVCRALHARMLQLATDRSLPMASRADAAEEAAQVAAGRLRSARERTDADAVAWWTPRATTPVERHGLGADTELELARALYVMQRLGT